MASRSRPGGRIALTQVVPKRSQRLYELCDWSAIPKELSDKVSQAEESIYLNSDDPLVNWDEDALVDALRDAGCVDVQATSEQQVEHRKIGAHQLDRWFGTNDAQNAEKRPTYAARLAAAGLDESEVELIGDTYRLQLLNQIVKWQSTLAYIVGKR